MLQGGQNIAGASLLDRLLAELPASDEGRASIAASRVVALEVSRRDRIWRCHLATPVKVPESSLKLLAERLCQRMQGLHGVHFVQHQQYTDLSELVAREWGFICKALADLAPGARGALKQVTPVVRGPELLCLECSDAVTQRLLDREKVLGAVTGLVQRFTGTSIRVVASCGPSPRSDETAPEQGQEPPVAEPPDVPAAHGASPDGGAADAPLDLPIVVLPPKSADPASQVLFGRVIKSDPQAISGIVDEKRGLTICGQVLAVDQRETGSGRTLVVFDITDFTDSITVKLFADPAGGRNPLAGPIVSGAWLKVRGTVQLDRRDQELVMMADDVMIADPPLRQDRAAEKRVELHLHTTLSAMDGLTKIEDAIKRAAQWGHPAIAITDHGVVQAFPTAYGVGQSEKVKIILGMEGYLVDDGAPICVNATDDRLAGGTYVVVDTETTGLRPGVDELIEICAVRLVGGQVAGEFQTFVRPSCQISKEISELTGITPADVAAAPTADDAVAKLLAFVDGACLVAHNAAFDWAFLARVADRLGGRPQLPLLDTVGLARALVPGLRNYKLDTLTAHFGVKNEARHRAGGDAAATALVFRSLLEMAIERGAETLADLNRLAGKTNITGAAAHHVVLLVQHQRGLRNLYRLVSRSHTEYFYRYPRIPRSLLSSLRDGLLVGSACAAGELVQALVAGASDEELEAIAGFYDYLEVQPVGNNAFLVRNGSLPDEEALRDLNRRIVALGRRLGKPVVATGDVHFLEPHDGQYRQVLQAGQGYEDADQGAALYFRTTDEMLAEFAYLGDEEARRIVVAEPRALAESIEDIQPVPEGTFPPRPAGAEEELRARCTDRARELFGDVLPEVVASRLEMELNAIIGNGYAGIYTIARDIVLRANQDGYLVGSRGSVGSSLVAHLSGITEVNPLPAHYRCPVCRRSEFPQVPAGTSGFDLPAKICPDCGAAMTKDGQDIKFEVFMGFKGNKVPDIDLNFSGEQQSAMHHWVVDYLGKESVYRAGTIATVAEKTAFGFARAYTSNNERPPRRAELQRLAIGCSGVKRTTGRHPGGLVVVPEGRHIEEFTPVQYPANDTSADMLTTHFDYDSMHDQLTKLDMLGHDDPTVIKLLGDITGIDVKQIPFDDPATLSLFSSVEALAVKPDDIGGCTVGTLGVPEFGTRFVRSMLEDTRPQTFSDLVRISGLSHGTMVWQGNQQDLIRNQTATLQEIVGCRDDILLYLTSCGMDALQAFNIMEAVRKGKGIKDAEVAAMQKLGVPSWYIDACRKISYLFPKAHAAAYVMMAFRIAYFKVHFPAAFYATYFSVRADDFDSDMIAPDVTMLRDRLAAIEAKGREAPIKEKNQAVILEVAIEMYVRGIKFAPVNLAESDAKRFLIRDGDLLAPFVAIPGLGEAAANSITDARAAGPFRSIQDLQARTRISRAVLDLLRASGALAGLPEDNQLSLF
ncbi:MAG: PolC-type DNA polymerase III [Chloroflexota bacterium]